MAARLHNMSITTISKRLITGRGVRASSTGGGSSGPTITTVQITNSSYVALDDLAVDVGGGYLKLLGTNFVSGCSAYINGAACTTTYISSTAVGVVAPALVSGTYSIMLFNPDKSGAIYLNLTASPFPAFSTTAGSLGTIYETGPANSSVFATSNSTVTYSISSGSLPPGVSLNSATGVLSGTTQLTGANTTYNFVIDATDLENQNSSRSFSLTVNTDVVTWDTPANGATIVVDQNVSTTQTLSATSAAGKSIIYTADQLPPGLSIAGSGVTGTPTTVGTTSTIFTASANFTGRTATRSVTWTVNVGGDIYFPYVALLLKDGQYTTNGSFVDSGSANSGSPFTITRTGTPTQGSMNPYWPDGYWSNYFNGSSALYNPNVSSMSFGATTNFTIEAWLNWTTTAAGNQTFFELTGTTRMILGRSTTGIRIFWNGTEKGTTYTFVTNTWYHIAVVRYSGTVSCYINGVSAITSFTDTVTWSSTRFNIAMNSDSVEPMTGYISNLRVVNGGAVYTSAFSSTIPTTPLTVNTSFGMPAITMTYSIGTGGAGGVNTGSGSFGGTSTVTVNGRTLTASGGNGGAYNTTTNPSGGTATGGTANIVGGSGAASTGDLGGGGGGGIGGASGGTSAAGAGGTGGSAINFNGLNAALSGTGYSLGIGGGGADAGSTPANARNGTAGTGIGGGGGGAGYYGGNGGAGSLGGGGGGAAGLTATNMVGGAGGNGVVVIQLNGTTTSVLTTGTSFSIPANTTSVKIWVIGAGGGGGGATNVDAGSAAGGGAGGIVYYTFTATSLLTCQGNRFKDAANSLTTFTRTSIPQVQTFQPFNPPAAYNSATYGGSVYFPGGTSYLSTTMANGLGSNNFTIEFWGQNLTTGSGFFSIGGTSSTDFAGITMSGDGGLYLSTTGSSWTYSGIGGLALGTTAVDYQWHHYAIVRNGANLVTYKDGVQVQSNAITGTLTNKTGFFSIGAKSDVLTGGMSGYVANFRIINGEAIYTAPFTPPTTPVTAVSNTQLLLNFALVGGAYDAAVQNNITMVGSIVTGSTGKWGSASIYFNGTSDYLNFPSNPALSFGTADNFTIEAWIYFNSFPSDMFIISGTAAGSPAGGFFGFTGTTLIGIGRAGVAWDYTATHGISPITWYHVAVTRTSGLVRTYVNGNQVGTTSSANTQAYNFGSPSTYIGSQGTVYYFNGRMQDLRVTRLSRSSTSTITLPTATFVGK